MKIYESGEDYLETILILKNRKDYVRSVDVARELGYSRASVSRAVSILKKDELIVVQPDGGIDFTEEGRKLAENIYEKHGVLRAFLIFLGVEESIASRDACRIEHVISADSFEMLKRHIAQCSDCEHHK